ncbi:exodeoxyribonuclease VII small subunit [Gallaecimonas mangrovi]|uniref:exodeoxyribonuclease VII small subunit n=1 Tax=Gallaecimonas mangrovi TaxID=2291597 RepID=UPI000E201902|nr:exodeoxyribonuclease VII small subunit [Gallaecimonas mangrovi]
MAKKQPENMTFEENLKELEAVVTQLEQGELSLDEALKQFERGVALSRESEQKLKAAEQKVQMLLDDGKSMAPFHQEPDA